MSRAVEIAHDKIREAILTQEFLPGQHLTEADLVSFCGVSRTPVRSALNRLAAAELVEIERNRGARVKSWQDHEIDDLFELRALIEGFSAARAAQRITEQQLAELDGIIVETDRLLGSKRSRVSKINEFLILNQRIHEQIWQASDSKRLLNLLSRLVDQSIQARTAARYTLDRVATSHQQHKELVGALHRRDELWAESVMRSHIRAAHAELTR